MKNTYRFGYFDEQNETYPKSLLEQYSQPITNQGQRGKIQQLVQFTRKRSFGKVQLTDHDRLTFQPTKLVSAEILDQQIKQDQEANLQLFSIIDDLMSQTQKYMGNNQMFGEGITAQIENQNSIIDNIRENSRQQE